MWKLEPWVETLTRFFKMAGLVVAALGTAILLFVDIPALKEVPDLTVWVILAVALFLFFVSDKVASDRHKLSIARLQLKLDERRDLQKRRKSSL